MSSKTKHLPFSMDYLTEEMLSRAENELGETAEMKREALAKFRKLIKEDTKLVCSLEDQYLIQFLRARKYNVKRALSLMSNYYHVKKNYTDIFGKCDLPGIKKNIYDKIVNMLPYRDADGAVIIIVQLYNWNVNEMKFSTFLHAITSLVLMCVDLQPASQICGVKFIVDTKGLGLRHARHVSPKQLHLIARGLMNCLPVRFRAIHIYNESVIISYMWNVLKLVLSEKIKNRVYFHASSKESLHKCINPAILPTEYGGSLEYDNSFWIKTLDDFEERYYELMSYGYKSRKSSQEES